MSVIKFDLSAIKSQKKDYKTKLLKYIKHLHKTIKDLETDIFALKPDKEYNQILGIQTVEKENQLLKENWNKLKEYLNYRKNNFDKLMNSDFASFEISGKRILIEELINKINKLEKGIN